MGTIYIEGQFKSSAKPVKVVGGSIGGGSGVDQEVLKNYATKAELQKKAVEDLTASIEGIDHDVVDKTLIIQ